MKAGWQTKTLGEVFEIERGGSPRPIDNFITDDPNGFNWIKIGDATASGKYIYKTKQKIRPEGAKRSRIVNDGDFILSNSMSFGRPYIMKTTGCIHDGWLVLREKMPNIDKNFIYHLLGSDLVYCQFDSLAAGSTVRNLNIELVRKVIIPLPPLPEQQRIVTILDEAFEGIATATANAKKNLNNARELFDSTVQSVFANREAGWEEKRLNQIADNLDSRRVPVTKSVRNSGAYPYYGASGIVDYVDEFIFDDDLLLVSEDGANLLARTYPIAFSICGKTWVNNHAHVLRFKETATQKLVELYLNSIPLDDYVSGMAQPKLNQKMLNTIVIPYPPLAEQQAIVAKFDELSTETKKLEATYQQKLVALDELKKSILNQAFSGHLH